MSKHTPGPWKRSTRSWGGKPYWVVEDHTGAIICQAEVGFHEYESGSFITVEEEIAANVKLIESAPNLLEALRALVRIHLGEYDPLVSSLPAWDAARAAVAKAEGETE